VKCRNCGSEIYSRRRFGGSSVGWVHGGPDITSAAIQNCPGAEPESIDDRIAQRVAELNAKRRLNKAERRELELLIYSGPVPRRIPPSDEVPF
jgi:hypothetical protein